MKDIFTFGEHPQLDGSIPVLKNNLATACPHSNVFSIENQKILGGKPVFIRLACNRNCPMLLQVERSLASDPSQKEPGFMMACASSPQFIQISEPENKPKLIK
jgi:hypothetical protein